MPHSVMELAVSSDGVAVSGSVWEEYNHDARLFVGASGTVHGPFTPTRPSGGINGVAIDRRYVYVGYDGHLLASIGVQGGYLAGPHPGVASADRFVGPRAVAIDGAGDLYTVESGLPGVGQRIWTDMGSMAIITKFRPDGRSVVWRDYGLEFGGVGEPSPDGAGSMTAAGSTDAIAPAATAPLPTRSIHSATPPTIASGRPVTGRARPPGSSIWTAGAT